MDEQQTDGPGMERGGALTASAAPASSGRTFRIAAVVGGLAVVVAVVWWGVAAFAGSPSADAAAGASSFGDGLWVVGVDIAPGTYRVEAPVVYADDNSYCYWTTYDDAAGGLDHLVATGLGDGRPTVVFDSVAAVEPFGCGTWVRVDPEALFKNADAATVIPEGEWLVGEDVAPGTYQTTAAVETMQADSDCFWNITHDLAVSDGSPPVHFDDDVLDSAQEGLPTVSLASGQVFTSSACGDWERVDD